MDGRESADALSIYMLSSTVPKIGINTYEFSG